MNGGVCPLHEEEATEGSLLQRERRKRQEGKKTEMENTQVLKLTTEKN